MKYTRLQKSACAATVAIVSFTWPMLSALAEPTPPHSRQELESNAASGDVSATVELAKDYFRGQGGEANPEKAAELFLAAAEKGNPEAMDWAGVLLSNGKGLPRDEKQALDWFQKSADLGHARGMLHLGLLMRQAKDIPTSNEEGLRWLKKASEAGEPEATAIIGRIYFTGDRLQPADRLAAIPYLKTAAESGEPACQNMLGLCYRDGGPVEVDREAAKKWFRKAAMQNDRKAQANLGVELGAGTPDAPDRTEAIAWLILARDQDEITAKKTFGEIQFNLMPEQIAEAQKLATELKKTLPPAKSVTRLPVSQ